MRHLERLWTYQVVYSVSYDLMLSGYFIVDCLKCDVTADETFSIYCFDSEAESHQGCADRWFGILLRGLVL